MQRSFREKETFTTIRQVFCSKESMIKSADNVHLTSLCLQKSKLLRVGEYNDTFKMLLLVCIKKKSDTVASTLMLLEDLKEDG